MTARRALLRFVGLWAVVAGVELLERVAYRAGVADGTAEAVDVAAELLVDLAAPDDAGDAGDAAIPDPLPFDITTLIAEHADCCMAGRPC